MGKQNDMFIDPANNKDNNKGRDKSSPATVEEVEKAIRRLKYENEQTNEELKKSNEGLKKAQDELKKAQDELKKAQDKINDLESAKAANADAIKKALDDFQAQAEQRIRAAEDALAAAQAAQVVTPSDFDKVSFAAIPHSMAQLYVVTVGGNDYAGPQKELLARIANRLDPDNEHNPRDVIGWIDKAGDPVYEMKEDAKGNKHKKLYPVTLEHLTKLGLVK